MRQTQSRMTFSLSLLFASCLALGAEPHRDQDRAEVLQWLRRFDRAYCESDTARSKDVAQKLLAAMEAQQRENPSSSDLLRYYVAECAFAVGDLDRAKSLAARVAADVDAVNAPAAEYLRWRVIRAQRGPDYSRRTWMSQQLRATAKWYPAGWAANWVLMDNSATTRPGDDSPRLHAATGHQFFAECDGGAMRLAAASYEEMGMPVQSIVCYRQAIGFLVEDDWLSKAATDLWLGMGDGYSQLGGWPQAIACYYNAVASGGDPTVLFPRIKTTRQCLNEKKPAPQPRSRPKLDALEDIARKCVRTQLYDDAIVAAELANRVRPAPDGKLLSEIHAAKAQTLQTIIDTLGEGGVFRGTKVSKESVVEALALARNPLAPPALAPSRK